uniref:Uncharacterized protein n=1 Tax=Oryza meridionalis TaxID=40149 RepID=A0A0E0DC10_9ORYZ
MAVAGLPFPLTPGQVVGAPMRPEHEGRSSARTARSGAVDGWGADETGARGAQLGEDSQIRRRRVRIRPSLGRIWAGRAVGGEGGGCGARAARNRWRRWRPRREGRAEEATAAATAARGTHGGGGATAARGPRGDGGCGSRTCINCCFSGLCTGKWLAAATSLLLGGLKNPSRGAPPHLWPDPVLAVGSFGRGWMRRLVQRTTVPWRRAGAGREPT